MRLGILQSLEVVVTDLWATNASAQLARARTWRPKGSAFACAALRQLAACKTLAQRSFLLPLGYSDRRRIGAEKRRRGLVREPTKKTAAVIPTRNTSSAKFAEAVNSYVGTRRDGDG